MFTRINCHGSTVASSKIMENVVSINLQRIKTYFVRTARYYGRELDDYMLQAWSMELEEFPAHDVERAFNKLREDPKRRNMPMPAEIREFLKPKPDVDTLAQNILAEIQQHLGAVAGNNFKSISASLSPETVEVVRRYGGWHKLSTCTDATSTLVAQLREQAKAVIKMQEIERRHLDQGYSLPEIKEEARHRPTQIGQVVKQLEASQGWKKP